MFYVQILLEHIFAPKCKFIIQRTLHIIDLNMLASYTYLCIMVNSHTHTHTHACKHIPTHTHTYMHTIIIILWYNIIKPHRHCNQTEKEYKYVTVYKKKNILYCNELRRDIWHFIWNEKKKTLTIMISISHN